MENREWRIQNRPMFCCFICRFSVLNSRFSIFHFSFSESPTHSFARQGFHNSVPSRAMNDRGCRRLIRSLVVLCPLAVLCACTPAVVVESTRTEVSVGGSEGPESAPTTQNAMDALQQQLVSREREVEQLRSQVQLLRGGAASGDAAGAPDQAESVGGAAAAAPTADAAAQITSLRFELAREQQRRQAVETELARVKEETSLPAFGDTRVPEADFLAVKQELVELRRSAAEDHEAPERLTAQLRELQQAGNPSAAASPDAVDNPDQAAQLDDLRREKDQLVQTLNQRLSASQQRTAELETALAAATVGGTAAGGDAAAQGKLAAENVALKTRLDEQRRRTEDLEAKLRVAARVNDLIYRLQSQQAAPRPQRRQPKHAAPPVEMPPNRFDHSPSTDY